MATDRQNRTILWTIIIVVLAVIIFVTNYASYLRGQRSIEDKYTQARFQSDARLDSLHCIELSLRDSLKNVDVRRNELTIIRTVFKTVYDTIHIKTVPVQIVNGLNSIINTPIPKE